MDTACRSRWAAGHCAQRMMRILHVAASLHESIYSAHISDAERLEGDCKDLFTRWLASISSLPQTGAQHMLKRTVSSDVESPCAKLQRPLFCDATQQSGFKSSKARLAAPLGDSLLATLPPRAALPATSAGLKPVFNLPTTHMVSAVPTCQRHYHTKRAAAVLIFKK